MKTIADALAVLVAYSYVRFSSPGQAEGDSHRRQTSAAAAWCERHGIQLDTSTKLYDKGKSAFLGDHRKNPERHALAVFLKLVEDDKVPRGSYLIIENLDRLSREHIQPALLLVLNLLQAGIRVVQLSPTEMVFDDKSDTLPVMMMMMELSRGHNESAIKSERVGAAWAQKRKAVRETGAFFTRNMPRWVKRSPDGKLVLIPERAAVIKRIFKLTASGYGLSSLVGLLTREGVPAFGDGAKWNRCYLSRILSDRRALGELQPRGAGKKPDGPPVTGYFPAVATEEQWVAARAGASQRRRRGGRIGKNVNVFAGLIHCAHDGGGYFVSHRTDPEKGRRPYRVMVNTAAVEGRSSYHSFRYEAFRDAVLSRLREIDPREVMGTAAEEAPDRVMVLSGELAAVESSIAMIEADLNANGESPVQHRRLREKEEIKRGMAAKLAEARQKAAHPLSEAWGEAHSLLSAVKNAPDPTDAQLRLRGALRSVVESIWLLVVPRGKERLAVVQVWFAGGSHRDYMIVHRAAGNCRPGGWKVASLAPEFAAKGGLDLRKREDSASLEAGLLALKSWDGFATTSVDDDGGA